ncbi:Leucine-rich repeat-containing protein 27 [Eumeta japonica]|uniref:Leucine-rich repeat-containing protein 27 n=1 Tax=Eumeta variegata TaxID=151549 RepID=A0A4C1V2C2_EUMVA|nr:Leucine-rich repeat-containing protein 27 [Eumeta japonica]
MASTFSQSMNLYEEELNEDNMLDYSSKNLENVPVLRNDMVCVLYLQNNKIKLLPDDFFESLPNLMWLDLRDNELRELPKFILNHPSLTHLLLQNNKLTSLPPELGTVHSLKILQLSGNALSYPPQEIVKSGTKKILDFLNEEFNDSIDLISEDTARNYSEIIDEGAFQKRSYDSEDEPKSAPLTVKVNEKESEQETPPPSPRYCPRFVNCRRKILPPHAQSRKYVKPFVVLSAQQHAARIKHNLRKEVDRNKQINILASREKNIQNRKTKELLQNWRIRYRNSQLHLSDHVKYSMDGNQLPYDTDPEYMTLLSRDDIERELPDKYKKKLVRRSKPSVRRKNPQDVQLAMKIKELFKTLEAIDLHRENMTPRTEQKVLKEEIKKVKNKAF